jgi:hypothetical protein
MPKLDELIKIVILFLFFGLIPKYGHSQDDELDPVTSTYALKNVTIIQAPGRTINNGMVVVENGLIKAVGTNVSIPVGAWIIPADSMYVYAGFISGLSNIGVPKPKTKDIKDDRKMTGTPSYERAGITPNISVRSMLDPKEKSISEYRKLGFTATQTVPHNGMISGTGALVLLGGTTNESMLLKENTTMFCQWQGADGVYPDTILGIMAKFRDMYRKASQARAYSAKYNSSSNGMGRPNSDLMLEALYPIVSKQMNVSFRTEDLLDITRALTLKEELGFNLMLGELKQGWDIIPQIKASAVPVFLSLELPEIQKKKEEKKEEELDDDEVSEPTPEEIEKEALEKRKNEMIKNYYTQPSKLSSQGIKFGFSTLGVKSKDFKSNIRNIIANGLSEEKALAALTTTPAAILGVSAIMGTVENGKMANLIVTDKPYFDEKSNVRYVFIDGIKYDFEVKKNKKKKSSGEDAIDAAGIWSYTTESPRGSSSGIINIEGSINNYNGTITTRGNTRDLSDIVVDGNNISFNYTVNFGQDVLVEVSIDVDGDTFEGTVSVGTFGSFPMEGSKEPEY